MAKFYYECVLQVDMTYMAPWGKGGSHAEKDDEDAPMLVRHSLRVCPSRGQNARGVPFPPDYIVTDKPLAKHFTDQIVKKVSRPAFDPYTGRKLPQRAYRKKITKIKFVLVPPDELMQSIIDNAIKKAWTPEMFQEVSTKVDLPIDPELARNLALMGPDEEPTEGEEFVQPEGQVVKAPVRRKAKVNAGT